MSKRGTNSVIDEVSEEEIMLSEFEKAATHFCRHLDELGITLEELLAGLPGARRTVFLRLYPELAHLVDTVNEDIP